MAKRRAAPKSLDDLQAQIGHRFDRPALLERALTHSSLSGGAKPVPDLERLEFLGDRVLGLFAAETLWRRFPDLNEGELAPRLNALVRKETCARASRWWGLDGLIRLSDQEDAAGGRNKTAILGDVCEAFLGALYIDGGLDAARKAYDVFWLVELDKLLRRHQDAKTTLQEWSQERRRGTPHYVVVNAAGPAHAPDFSIEVRIEGYAPAGGAGRSKRQAQMAAAEAFLVREGVWDPET